MQTKEYGYLTEDFCLHIYDSIFSLGHPSFHLMWQLAVVNLA